MDESKLNRELCALLGATALAIGGCGGDQSTPVNATEVPSAAPAASPEAPPAEPAADPAAAAPAPAPTEASTAAPATASTALPMAKEMPKGNKSQKVRDSKRTKACESGCGEGTCGTPCK